jgi:hypothetical protein
MTRATPGASVGAGALPPHWQTTAMSHATVAADLPQALYIQIDFPLELTFYPEPLLDQITQTADLFLSEVFGFGIRAHLAKGQDLLA